MCGVGSLQVVELLPDGKLGAQVDVTGVVEQLATESSTRPFKSTKGPTPYCN
jgi:hypothetical protein